jgi:hypothetical protein
MVFWCVLVIFLIRAGRDEPATGGRPARNNIAGLAGVATDYLSKKAGMKTAGRFTTDKRRSTQIGDFLPQRNARIAKRSREGGDRLGISPTEGTKLRMKPPNFSPQINGYGRRFLPFTRPRRKARRAAIFVAPRPQRCESSSVQERQQLPSPAANAETFCHKGAQRAQRQGFNHGWRG